MALDPTRWTLKTQEAFTAATEAARKEIEEIALQDAETTRREIVERAEREAKEGSQAEVERIRTAAEERTKLEVEAARGHVEHDPVAVPDQRDGPTVNRLGRDVPHAQPVGCT